MTSQKTFFLDFSVLDTMYRWSMMKNIHSPNWVGMGPWGPKIWPHEYVISPIWNQCKLAWFQTVISGHHEPIHVKFGVWGFFIMFYWNIVIKCWNAKKKIWWRHTSVFYIKITAIMHRVLWGKGKLMETLSVHSEVSVSFSLATGPDYSI